MELATAHFLSLSQCLGHLHLLTHTFHHHRYTINGQEFESLTCTKNTWTKSPSPPRKVWHVQHSTVRTSSWLNLTWLESRWCAVTHSREDHTYKYCWIQFPSNLSTHTANLTVRSRYTKACGWGFRLLVWVRLHAVRAAALPLRECRSLREGLPSRFHCGGSGSDQRVVLHSDGHLYVSLQQTRWAVLCQGSAVQCSAVQCSAVRKKGFVDCLYSHHLLSDVGYLYRLQYSAFVLMTMQYSFLSSMQRLPCLLNHSSAWASQTKHSLSPPSSGSYLLLPFFSLLESTVLPSLLSYLPHSYLPSLPPFQPDPISPFFISISFSFQESHRQWTSTRIWRQKNVQKIVELPRSRNRSEEIRSG